MKFRLYTGEKWKLDFIPRLGSFWMGCHWSYKHQSYCFTLIPCLVFRFGKTEYKADPDIFERKPSQLQPTEDFK